MKLIKAIRLHRKLRIKQEVLCDKVVKHSEDMAFKPVRTVSPHLSGLSSVNKAVRNVEKKLPWIYFLMSDIFGGASSLRKQSKKAIEESK